MPLPKSGAITGYEGRAQIILFIALSHPISDKYILSQISFHNNRKRLAGSNRSLMLSPLRLMCRSQLPAKCITRIRSAFSLSMSRVIKQALGQVRVLVLFGFLCYIVLI